MALLHSIWLTGELHLSVMSNFCNLGDMFSKYIKEKEVFCPLFWLDKQALQQLILKQKLLNIKLVSKDENTQTQLLFSRVQEEIFKDHTLESERSVKLAKSGIEKKVRLLKIEVSNGADYIYLPIFVWEEVQPLIENILKDIFESTVKAVKDHGKRLPDNFSVLNKLFEIIDLVRDKKQQVVPQTIPVSIASDVMRIIILIIFGGMYVDVNDVKLKCLPKNSNILEGINFMYRLYQDPENSIIENDALFVRRGSQFIRNDLMRTLCLIAEEFATSSLSEYIKMLYDFNNIIYFMNYEDVMHCKDTTDKIMIIQLMAQNKVFMEKHHEKCMLERKQHQPSLAKLYTLLIWNKTIRAELVSIKSLKNYTEQRKLLGDFYEKYSINHIYYSHIPHCLVGKCCFSQFGKDGFSSTDCIPFPFPSNFFLEDVFEKSLCSWETPGLSLIEQMKFLKKQIKTHNPIENPLYIPAVKELAKIYEQYPPSVELLGRQLFEEASQKSRDLLLLVERFKQSLTSPILFVSSSSTAISTSSSSVTTNDCATGLRDHVDQQPAPAP